MNDESDIQITVEDRDLGAGWHLKALVVIVVVMAVVYILAVNLVLK